jgi:hypothetical protein
MYNVICVFLTNRCVLEAAAVLVACVCKTTTTQALHASSKTVYKNMFLLSILFWNELAELHLFQVSMQSLICSDILPRLPGKLIIA